MLPVHPAANVSSPHFVWNSSEFTRDSEAGMGIVGNGGTEARARVQIGPRGGGLLTFL